MKKPILVALFMLASCASAQSESSMSLPRLHVIQSVTFSKPYSCNSMSYESSALFLSEFARNRNMPDLLYNGACRSEPSMSATTAGDDFTLISDLGKVPLEKVTAHKALNWTNIVGQDNKFQQTIKPVVGHTYAVLISKQEIRALYVLTVDSIEQDGPMTIRYAVKSYSVQNTKAASRGFEWEKGSK